MRCCIWIRHTTLRGKILHLLLSMVIQCTHKVKSCSNEPIGACSDWYIHESWFGWSCNLRSRLPSWMSRSQSARGCLLLLEAAVPSLLCTLVWSHHPNETVVWRAISRQSPSHNHTMATDMSEVWWLCEAKHFDSVEDIKMMGAKGTHFQSFRFAIWQLTSCCVNLTVAKSTKQAELNIIWQCIEGQPCTLDIWLDSWAFLLCLMNKWIKNLQWFWHWRQPLWIAVGQPLWRCLPQPQNVAEFASAWCNTQKEESQTNGEVQWQSNMTVLFVLDTAFKSACGPSAYCEEILGCWATSNRYCSQVANPASTGSDAPYCWGSSNSHTLTTSLGSTLASFDSSLMAMSTWSPYAAQWSGARSSWRSRHAK